jgi:hypothetical protein
MRIMGRKHSKFAQIAVMKLALRLFEYATPQVELCRSVRESDDIAERKREYRYRYRY